MSALSNKILHIASISSITFAALAFFSYHNLHNVIEFAEAVPESKQFETQQPFEKLQPNKSHIKTSLSIAGQLRQMHYKDEPLDDDLSSKILDRYLKMLDSSKSYFTKADIVTFEEFRFTLDNALKSGNLSPAFYIFNIYQERVINRLNALILQVENHYSDLDFTIDESLHVDQDKADWPNDQQALNEIWRKRLKSSILNLKLSDKNDKEIQKLLLKRYKNQLSRTLQTNADDAFQTYIDALTYNYDPHTQYLSPRSTEDFNIHMSLSLEGIGAVLQSEDEYTKIVKLIPAGPADKSGKLAPADKIIGVGQDLDGEIVDIVGWRLEEVVRLIRGRKNSMVRLEIIPSGSDLETGTKIVKIIRNTVTLEEQSAQKSILNLHHEGKTFKLGVIDIPAFYLGFRELQAGKKDYRSTTKDVSRLIKELQEENIDALMIDLRNNGGGSLQEANSLTGLFIDQGATVQVKYSDGRINPMMDDTPGVFYDGPLAVLVNRMSASASEIFSGAIQDYGRGLVIGGRTFGKGTVQSLIPLNEGQLKITLAKFYRVSGESNQHKGIIPDIAFPSLFDNEEIGESALENSLPWDTIAPSAYLKNQDFKPFIPLLTEKHKQRIINNPDFIHLEGQIDLLAELRNKTSVSLLEKERKSENQQLENKRLKLENELRKAKALPLISNLEELEKEERDKALDDNDKKGDEYLLEEAGHILADMVFLTQQQTMPKIAKQALN